MDMICQMALKDWRTLNSLVGALTEEQLTEMLEFEVTNEKRTTFVVRLHQKLAAIKVARERADWLQRCIAK